MDDAGELLDLVDATDTVIGQVRRGTFADPAHRPAGNIRAAEAFIVNTRSELWVPKRSLHKKMWPGGYDFSAAEHVMAGETYRQAMLRGLREELRMEIPADKLVFLGKIKPDTAVNLFVFRAVYKIQQDTPPLYNKDDFMGYEWLAPQELARRIAAGEPAKDSLPSALTAFF